LTKCDIKKYFLYFDIILFNIYFIFILFNIKLFKYYS